MSKINAKISTKYRYFFYLMLMMSFISGSGYWLLKNYFMSEGDFGPQAHFLQYPLLQSHGFFAFWMLLCFGAIFASHIPVNWHRKQGRKSGVALLSAIGVLLICSYSLYYLVSQDWHWLLANSHTVIGITLPFILILHLKLARKSKNNKHTPKYKYQYSGKRTLN